MECITMVWSLQHAQTLSELNASRGGTNKPYKADMYLKEGGKKWDYLNQQVPSS